MKEIIEWYNQEKRFDKKMIKRVIAKGYYFLNLYR